MERRWDDFRSEVVGEIVARVLEKISGKEIAEEAVEQVAKKIGEDEEITRRKMNLILYKVTKAESQISSERVEYDRALAVSLFEESLGVHDGKDNSPWQDK